MTAVSTERWQQAQVAERKWWTQPGQTERRLADRCDDAAWYAGLLNISEHRDSRRVLDIGGGPLPLSEALGFDYPSTLVDVLDPCDYGDIAAHGNTIRRRILEPAESFVVEDGHYDEVWGYNVLQHVIDPAQVIATAKRAARIVRWLDWTNTPIHEVHPHSISESWLLQQFTGWRLPFVTTGTIRRPDWSHTFIAIVAERL